MKAIRLLPLFLVLAACATPQSAATAEPVASADPSPAATSLPSDAELMAAFDPAMSATEKVQIADSLWTQCLNGAAQYLASSAGRAGRGGIAAEAALAECARDERRLRLTLALPGVDAAQVGGTAEERIARLLPSLQAQMNAIYQANNYE